MIAKTSVQKAFLAKNRRLFDTADQSAFDSAIDECFDEVDVAKMLESIQFIMSAKKHMKSRKGKSWTITKMIKELLFLRRTITDAHFKLSWLKKCGQVNRQLFKNSHLNKNV